ncbi:hypothetical protein RB653_009750 [Dictyostelium firmibasis]|uniref:XPG-I domain-containing protein n=1 Tax=Dictyostelium firmibasis TaxID=79012 RepID=A0AAN7TRT8_9MYCE
MGVQGFSTFIKKRTPKVGVPVDLLYESKKKKILIGIDGSSFIFHVVNQISRMNSLILFRDYVLEFFKTLRENNVECCVFVDGFNAYDKANEHEKRYIQRTELYKRNADLLLTDVESRQISHYQFPHPLFSKEFTTILKELKIPVFVSRFEADKELAQWALDNQSDHLLGIFSNDSDFFFFDTKCFYFPLDQLSFQKNSITMIGYTFDRISTSLSIKKSKLPFLASLIGNDQTKHIRGNKKFGLKNAQERSICITNLVKNQNGSDLGLIKQIYFVSPSDIETINKSVKGYLLESMDIKDIIIDENSKSKFRKSTISDINIFNDQRNESEKNLEDVLFSISGHTSRIYNFSKLVYPMNYTTHRHCFEPSNIPFQTSILNFTTTLSSHLFGLLVEIPDRADTKITEYVTDSGSQLLKLTFTPSYLAYSHHQCFSNQVSFNQRLFDYCKLLNSLSYYYTLSKNNTIQIDPTTFDFYNFYIITTWNFVLSHSSKFSIKIEDWMIDTLIVQSLFLKNGIKIDFGLHNDSFQPLYIGEFFLVTLRWSLDLSDAMALPKYVISNGGDGSLQPSHFFETIYVHPLWKMANLNYRNRILQQKSLTIPDRLKCLFEPVNHLFTTSIISQFTYIKYQLCFQ